VGIIPKRPLPSCQATSEGLCDPRTQTTLLAALGIQPLGSRRGQEQLML